MLVCLVCGLDYGFEMCIFILDMVGNINKICFLNKVKKKEKKHK